MAGVLVIKIAGLSSGCGLEKHKAIVCCQGREKAQDAICSHPLNIPNSQWKKKDNGNVLTYRKNTFSSVL
jgi:hypothetical protein